MGILSLGIFGLVLFSFASSDLTRNVAGKILLDVQRNGEAWYVHPVTMERYYLGTPEDAYKLMRVLGLGISNQHLETIPKPGQAFVGDRALRERLSGRILLQVQSHGEAWYVDPQNLQRHYLGSARDAFAVMREFGLGITHEQLQQIPDGGEVAASSKQTIPFTAQAPFAEWDDLRQQEGCEEASALMAMHWVYGTEISLEYARQEIVTMSDKQKLRYGTFVDTSAKDTIDRIFKDYFNYHDLELQYDISPSDIRNALAKGHLVIVPVNGKTLRNPYFRAGGPQRHMIVIVGFDWATGEFITHEPGTKRGENYRYSYEIMRQSLRDYPSGNYVPIPENSPTAMIVVKK